MFGVLIKPLARFTLTGELTQDMESQRAIITGQFGQGQPNNHKFIEVHNSQMEDGRYVFQGQKGYVGIAAYDCDDSYVILQMEVP